MRNRPILNALGVLGVLAVLTGAASSAGAADDWNQWRGPNRDGHIPGFQAPARWPKSLVRRWSVAVGEGHSSPLIIGESVYSFARQGEEEVIRRLDLATGREVWRRSYPTPYEMNPAARPHGKGPKSTPLYRDGRLYTLGISGILSCLDARAGKVLWRKEFSKQYKTTSPEFGAAMSPLVDGGRGNPVPTLIVHIGGRDNGALTAFDAKTGAVRWRWAGDGPGYASPILVTLGGVRQIVTQTQQRCVGISADSGRLLWSLKFTTPYEQNVITPLLMGDLLIFGGTQQPTFACRVRRNGERWTTERVWETRAATLYMSTPVADGKRLYGVSERRRGQLFCLDVATGKTLWTDGGNVGENASILDGGSVLLVLAPDAQLRVLKKSGSANMEAARYTVADSPTWATPAVTGNRLLVKDATRLTLWEIPASR